MGHIAGRPFNRPARFALTEETAMRWGRWAITGLISVCLVWFVWWHVNRTMQPAHAELITSTELLQ